MTAEQWELEIERLRGRMSVQESEIQNHKEAAEARFRSIEASIDDKLMRFDRRLVNIETNTSWIVRLFIAGALTTVFLVLFGLAIFAASIGFDPMGVTGALKAITELAYFQI